MGKSFVEVDDNLSDIEIVSHIKSGEYEYFKVLMNRYMPLVTAISKKFSVLDSDLDDLIQEGRLAVFSAVKSYDADKSSFKTFATLCITRAISDFVKSDNIKRRVPKNMITDISQTELPTDESPEKILLDKESYTALTENIKSCLSNLEYCVLCSFILGKSYSQIASYLGISEKSVENALKRIRAKLIDI
ncbi:MAG: sigma-70 family RNA polymerase sigma factor [Clostridia bacterium]|nr:sigma-70 family RNA polymerase sigma factor [Clostridia bacterium]